MLADLSPFIWRKYLDFAALGDIHEMKRQIQAYRGHGEVAVEGHNIKLGRGGIREIEFFVQTQQLIAGGRHPQLRSRETLATLAGAVRRRLDRRRRARRSRTRLPVPARSRAPPADGRGRADPYAALDPGRARSCSRVSSAIPTATPSRTSCSAHLGTVQQHYVRLFEDAPARAAERRGLVFPPDADAHETLDKLSEMGFRQALEASATVRRWLAGAPRALKGPAARAVFAELVPLLIDHIARAENPDAALVTFDRFLGNLHGGARLFSLLRQNPDLVALVARVLGTAPRLADILAQHPAGDGCAHRPRFFRRPAGTGEARGDPFGFAGASGLP